MKAGRVDRRVGRVSTPPADTVKLPTCRPFGFGVLNMKRQLVQIGYKLNL